MYKGTSTPFSVILLILASNDLNIVDTQVFIRKRYGKEIDPVLLKDLRG